MSTNHTSNYNLNQWVKSDRVLMEEFNADNAKIDAAIKAVNNRVDGKASASAVSSLQSTVNGHTTALESKGNCQLYAFSYTGSGGETKVFTFPKKPAVVVVFNSTVRLFLFTGQTYAWYETRSANYGLYVSWSGNSVTLSGGSPADQMDAQGQSYHAVALLYAG